MKRDIVSVLSEFARGKEIEPFGPPQSRIIHDVAWNILDRVWNDGRGRIQFATMDGETLLINAAFCSVKEVEDISKNLKIPFEFVVLGYPDYYNKGLKGVKEGAP